MAEAVREFIKIGRKKFPGYIKTALSDIDFIRSVLKNWAQFDDDSITRMLIDSIRNDEFEDFNLKEEGYSVKGGYNFAPPEQVVFYKLNEGKWTIADMSFEELDKFAEDCEGNLD